MPATIDFEHPPSVDPAIRMTDEELIRFSEENRPFRFERNKYGEIVTMTPVGGKSSRHEALVSSALFMWNEQAGTGVAFGPNVGFNLPDGSCLAPDAAWIPLARWEALTPKQQAGLLPFAPEFLIEVRSQSDSRRVLEAKMESWMENGAQLAWLVDPVAGSISIYRPGEPTEMLERPDFVQGHGPVAGFRFRATRLWE